MNKPVRKSTTNLLLALCCSLAGCGGGHEILKEPRPMTLTPQSIQAPLAQADDPQLAVSLAWVIVRDGPGTWAKNADWDEYLLQVVNTSGEPLQVTMIAVYDSLGTRIVSSGDRKVLVAGSRATVRRYEGEGVEVKAGVGGGGLMLAGVGIGASSLTAGALAVASGASYTGGAAIAGLLGAGILAPAVVFGGVIRGVNNGRVSREIESRQVVVPLELEPEEARDLHVFFPLAPSPRRIELTYVDSAGEHVLRVNTEESLLGLHVVPGEEPAQDDAVESREQA
jgi:hypothetical protein